MKASLTQGKNEILEIYWPQDVRVFHLPEGSVHVESNEHRAMLHVVKDKGLNLATLPLVSHHVLHQGVTAELNIQEKCALIDVSEYKVDNQKPFVEMTQALKEQEELCTQCQSLVTTIEQACKSVPELGIPDDVEALAKVKKLATVVCTSMEKVDKVIFDLRMQIDELQLNLQLTTPLEVREQMNVTIKESKAQLDVTVQGCDKLFTQALGLWDTMPEDPTLQQLSTEHRETQKHYDEISTRAWMLALVQRFTCLQEGKEKCLHIQELQKKNSVLSTPLEPQIEEANQFSQTILENLKDMQQTQRTTQLVVDGPTIEKLVQKVQQEANQSTAQLHVLTKALNKLHQKVEQPVE